MLSDAMNDEEMAGILQDIQQSLGHSLPLGSYLLKPVQRILKYPLLLQSIAKHTDAGEEGYSVVCEAVDTMINYASHINDMKRKKESLSNDSGNSSPKVWIWLPLSSKSKQSFHKLLSRKTVMKTLSQASKSSWVKLQHRLGKKKDKSTKNSHHDNNRIKDISIGNDKTLANKSASLPAKLSPPVK
jgi:hypothetical protein